MGTRNNQQLLVICAESENYEQIRRERRRPELAAYIAGELTKREVSWRKATSMWCFARTRCRTEIFARLLRPAAHAVPVIVLSRFA